jgi:hypothetical protein
MPISVTTEIARLENVDGERCHDLELAKKVSVMSKITLASSAEECGLLISQENLSITSTAMTWKDYA